MIRPQFVWALARAEMRSVLRLVRFWIFAVLATGLGTIFYLYNPGGYNPGGADLIEALERRFRALSALRAVMYYNPKHASFFDATDRWHVTHRRLSSPDGAPYCGLATVTPQGQPSVGNAPGEGAN